MKFILKVCKPLKILVAEEGFETSTFGYEPNELLNWSGPIASAFQGLLSPMTHSVRDGRWLRNEMGMKWPSGGSQAGRKRKHLDWGWFL